MERLLRLSSWSNHLKQKTVAVGGGGDGGAGPRAYYVNEHEWRLRGSREDSGRKRPPNLGRKARRPSVVSDPTQQQVTLAPALLISRARKLEQIPTLAMSLVVKLKQFRIIKCKGDKFAKVEFRGEIFSSGDFFNLSTTCTYLY